MCIRNNIVNVGDGQSSDNYSCNLQKWHPSKKVLQCEVFARKKKKEELQQSSLFVWDLKEKKVKKQDRNRWK